MQKVVFFDLDGTLWDSRHPLLQTAWDRLPQAWTTIGGEIPNGFNWSQLAGSTEYAVVKQLVDMQFPTIDESIKEQLIQQTISEMDRHYFEHAPTDISPALYNDTQRGLQHLRDQGWTLGIITGNSEPVARHKLQAAGLLQFFSTDPKLLYFGENYKSRAEMMKEAWVQSMIFGHERPKVPPLIYVADTLRDLTESSEAWWRQSSNYLSLEYRILLRLQPAVYPYIREINNFNNGYKDITAQLFETIGDDHFTQTVRRESRFDWVSARELERGW
ncbi:MAG TPA: HAD family hydrolase [Candidatus Woesebacteria bacterium]|nr:HAD family hydrolase [Candidatus Woesebacteria bacterium]